MMTANLNFVLYACCIPTKGAKRSIVCDLQRNSFIYIPNGLFELFENNVSLLVTKLDNSIREILDYLVENEYGFYTNEIDKFPLLNKGYESDIPNEISSLIIDFNSKSDLDLEIIAKNINDIRLYAIEIRCFDSLSNRNIIDLIQKMDLPLIRTLHLFLKHTAKLTDDFLAEIITSSDSIKQIIIHSAPFDKVKPKYFGTSIIYSTEAIKDETHCGNIAPNYFESNLPQFKNRKVNNCLHGKISIDSKGFIKNCPSMSNNFGHISRVTLLEALSNIEYKKYWYIAKSEISVCKDCEFRYICLDCRVYRTDDSILSKPKKCSYDPYTNSWQK